jgi:hypothetical protein
VLAQQRQAPPCAEERSDQVHPQHTLERFRRRVVDRREVQDGGVVDQHVEPALGATDVVDRGLPVALARDIEPPITRIGAEPFSDRGARVDRG